MWSEVAQLALRYLGVPYRLGGDSPDTGFDCSGFVRYVIGLATRLEMPRTVEEQYRVGARIGDADIRAGDLVFFSTVAPGASHVGIAIDNGEFIHAPATNGSVRVEHLEAGYWHDRFIGARRLF
jgi:cell wall-associated NlpC family hydrolase